MTARFMVSTTASATAQLPSADNVAAVTAGDVAVLVANLADSTAISSYTDGAVLYATAGTSAGWTYLGRTLGSGGKCSAVWAKQLTGSDISAGKMLAVKFGTWTNISGDRIHLIVWPSLSANGWDLAAAKASYFKSHNTNAGTGEQTVASFSKPPRAGIAVSVFNGAGDNALVGRWDGGSQTEPYFNEGTTGTDTTDTGTHHYGTNLNSTQADVKEYTSGASTVTHTWSSGANNTTHAFSLVFIPVAATTVTASALAGGIVTAGTANPRRALKARAYAGGLVTNATARVAATLRAHARSGGIVTGSAGRGKISARARAAGDLVTASSAEGYAGAAPPTFVYGWSSQQSNVATLPTSPVGPAAGDLLVVVAEYEPGTMPSGSRIMRSGVDAGYDLHGTVNALDGSGTVRIWSRVATNADCSVFGSSFLLSGFGPEAWAGVGTSRWQVGVWRHARGFDADPANRLAPLGFVGQNASVTNGSLIGHVDDLDVPAVAVVGLFGALSTTTLTFDGVTAAPYWDESASTSGSHYGTNIGTRQAGFRTYAPGDTGFNAYTNAAQNSTGHAHALAVFRTKPPQTASARAGGLVTSSTATPRITRRASARAGGIVTNSSARSKIVRRAHAIGDLVTSGRGEQPSPMKRAAAVLGGIVTAGTAAGRVIHRAAARAGGLVTGGTAEPFVPRTYGEGDTISYGYGFPRLHYRAHGGGHMVTSGTARQVNPTQRFAGGRGAIVTGSTAVPKIVHRAGGAGDVVLGGEATGYYVDSRVDAAFDASMDPARWSGELVVRWAGSLDPARWVAETTRDVGP